MSPSRGCVGVCLFALHTHASGKTVGRPPASHTSCHGDHACGVCHADGFWQRVPRGRPSPRAGEGPSRSQACPPSPRQSIWDYEHVPNRGRPCCRQRSQACPPSPCQSIWDYEHVPNRVMHEYPGFCCRQRPIAARCGCCVPRARAEMYRPFSTPHTPLSVCVPWRPVATLRLSVRST